MYSKARATEADLLKNQEDYEEIINRKIYQLVFSNWNPACLYRWQVRMYWELRR